MQEELHTAYVKDVLEQKRELAPSLFLYWQPSYGLLHVPTSASSREENLSVKRFLRATSVLLCLVRLLDFKCILDGTIPPLRI